MSFLRNLFGAKTLRYGAVDMDGLPRDIVVTYIRMRFNAGTSSQSVVPDTSWMPTFNNIWSDLKNGIYTRISNAPCTPQWIALHLITLNEPEKVFYQFCGGKWNSGVNSMITSAISSSNWPRLAEILAPVVGFTASIPMRSDQTIANQIAGALELAARQAAEQAAKARFDAWKAGCSACRLNSTSAACTQDYYDVGASWRYEAGSCSSALVNTLFAAIDAWYAANPTVTLADGKKLTMTNNKKQMITYIITDSPAYPHPKWTEGSLTASQRLAAINTNDFNALAFDLIYIVENLKIYEDIASRNAANYNTAMALQNTRKTLTVTTGELFTAEEMQYILNSVVTAYSAQDDDTLAPYATKAAQIQFITDMVNKLRYKTDFDASVWVNHPEILAMIQLNYPTIKSEGCQGSGCQGYIGDCGDTNLWPNGVQSCLKANAYYMVADWDAISHLIGGIMRAYAREWETANRARVAALNAKGDACKLKGWNWLLNPNGGPEIDDKYTCIPYTDAANLERVSSYCQSQGNEWDGVNTCFPKGTFTCDKADLTGFDWGFTGGNIKMSDDRMMNECLPYFKSKCAATAGRYWEPTTTWRQMCMQTPCQSGYTRNSANVCVITPLAKFKADVIAILKASVESHNAVWTPEMVAYVESAYALLGVGKLAEFTAMVQSAYPGQTSTFCGNRASSMYSLYNSLNASGFAEYMDGLINNIFPFKSVNCNEGLVWDGSNCVEPTCPAGTTRQGSACYDANGNRACPSGQTWNGAECIGNATPDGTVCPSGQVWDATLSQCTTPAGSSGSSKNMIIIAGIGVLVIGGVIVAVVVAKKKGKSKASAPSA